MNARSANYTAPSVTLKPGYCSTTRARSNAVDIRTRELFQSVDIRTRGPYKPTVLYMAARGDLVEFSVDDFAEDDGDEYVASGSIPTYQMEDILSEAYFHNTACHFIQNEDFRVDFDSLECGGLRIRVSERESDCDGEYFTTLEVFKVDRDGVATLWAGLVAD